MVSDQSVAQIYQAATLAGRIESDSAQLNAIAELDRLRTNLLEHPNKPRTNFLTRLLAPQAASTGLYLWGGVGTGKTFLMDTFFNSLPFKDKTRVHFYRFMKQTHEALKEHAGVANPLSVIAKKWGQHNRVICFDEFLVNDIADAMLLGELLVGLFQQNVCLVATSNLAPDNLYANGLQRARFLMAIDMLTRHTKVVELASQTDYRRRALTEADIFRYPLTPDLDACLMNTLGKLSCLEMAKENQPIEINGREIISRVSTEDAVWFDFSELCATARSQLDYIEITTRYAVLLLSNVPALGSRDDDKARRFISLIDELYDRNVKLVMSSEVAPDELYQGERLVFEFERVRSRLNEMQSAEFLSLPHNRAKDSLL